MTDHVDIDEDGSVGVLSWDACGTDPNEDFEKSMMDLLFGQAVMVEVSYEERSQMLRGVNSPPTWVIVQARALREQTLVYDDLGL